MKKLYKLRSGQKLLGVCAGIAEYLEVDVSVVRILCVFVSLTGAGVVAYIAAGFILPFKDEVA